MTDRPADPWGPDGPTLPSSPPVEGPVAVDGGTVRRGGLGARVVAVGVGASLLVGGLAFAATQAGTDEGSGSAEAAVSRLFDALADEDVLGVLASLDQGERDTLREPTEAMFDELRRLGVVDDFELSGVPGVDLEFDDLAFRTEPIAPGLARVHLTSGTATYSVDGTELPVGDFLADALDRFGVHQADLAEQDEDPITPEDDTFLVARETADGWRVSLTHTAVEAFRLDQDSPRPVPATGLAPIGADSPEAAVEGLVRAAAAIDLRGVVARLSPLEAAALHRYWPVLEADADLPTPEDVGGTVEITDLELDADTDGDRAVVRIRAIGGDVDTDDFTGGLTVADGCVTLRGDAYESIRDEVGIDDETICQDDLGEVLDEAADELGGFATGGFEDLALPELDGDPIGITTTRVDGAWYVAPVRTVADVGLSLLRSIDREDLEGFVDEVEDLFGGGFLFGDGFSEGFVPPGLEDGLEGWGGELGDELDGAEGFEDLDLGAIGEELEQLGEAVDPAFGARTTALVEELVAVLAGDEEVAACVLGELQLTASSTELDELAAGYEQGSTPSELAQQLLDDALEACGA